ncbi:phage holin family protein [Aerococcus urinaeequi]|uniref:phage holin family protein n=1 Tax=Aerococcus urinaeequi TaxID=51665 RepID=UPI00084625C2|nr:phage holin family protein [Aerococcus urinaeequi]
MRRFILATLIDALGLMAVSWILAPNVYVADFWSAILVAIVLSIVNSIIRPIVNLLALPLNILTFGLFRLVVNGFMFIIVGLFFPTSFVFANFFYAIAAAFLFSMYHWFFEKFIEAGK